MIVDLENGELVAAVCAKPGAAQMYRYYTREGPPPAAAPPEPVPAWVHKQPITL